MDIGIDLGTTFSVIAVNGKVDLVDGYPDGVYLEECEVTIIPTPAADLTFPSVVAADPENPGQCIVGMEAKDLAREGESPVMWSKRKIGTTESLRIGDRTITAKEAAKEILVYLKACAERALGEPVERAVITHPAYFDRNQVEETREAAEMAGFEMTETEQMLMEPVAAALAYARVDPSESLKAMVYDLGGGTFDVTIVERRQGTLAVRAFDGNHLLGGANFDRKLAEWVLAKCREKGREVPYDETNPEHRSMRAQLLQECEALKEKLASMGGRKKVKTAVRLNFLVDAEGRSMQVREQISQEEFVELIQDELAETIACCRSCLSKADDMAPEDLDYILLVGGSTFGPWIAEAVEQAFVGTQVLSFGGDDGVAAGAAIQTTLLPKTAKGAGLELVLDVPERSVLPTITVSGTVRRTAEAAGDGFSVLVLAPGGKTLGPTTVADDGAFIVEEEVELLDEEPTEMTLQVIDANGTPHISHGFSVTYMPDDADGDGGGIGPATTVLPKPLYVRTAGGLYPLAEEGMLLPSEEKEHTFTREFDGDVVDIDIYQEDEKAGSIVIDNIPEGAGKGTKVKLRVCVTEKNEVKGRYELFSAQTGASLVEGPVRVTFPPVPVPELTDLRARFQELDMERLELAATSQSAEIRMQMEGKGRRLSAQIEEKLGEMEPDRQEIAQAMKELEMVVRPPKDDMEPPRAAFMGLVAECRELLEGKKEDPQSQALGRLLERIEREANDAYRQKNQHKLAAVFDSLRDLHRRIMPGDTGGNGGGGGGGRPEPQVPETPILKDQVAMTLDQDRASLDDARQIRLDDTPERYEAVWEPECRKVEELIDKMQQQVAAIADDMDNKQALNKIQVTLRMRQEVQRRIALIREGVAIGQGR